MRKHEPRHLTARIRASDAFIAQVTEKAMLYYSSPAAARTRVRRVAAEGDAELARFERYLERGMPEQFVLRTGARVIERATADMRGSVPEKLTQRARTYAECPVCHATTGERCRQMKWQWVYDKSSLLPAEPEDSEIDRNGREPALTPRYAYEIKLYLPTRTYMKGFHRDRKKLPPTSTKRARKGRKRVVDPVAERNELIRRNDALAARKFRAAEARKRYK